MCVVALNDRRSAPSKEASAADLPLPQPTRMGNFRGDAVACGISNELLQQSNYSTKSQLAESHPGR
jgi:hypothetical protein